MGSKNKKNQDEAESEFINHFISYEYPDAVPLKIEAAGAPDYFLEKQGVVVEIKELIDQEQWSKSVVWERSYQKIKDAIRAHPSFHSIDGEYVAVSDYFQLAREKKIKTVANRFVEAILKEDTTFSINGWKFRLGKVVESEIFNISFVGMNFSLGSKKKALGEIIKHNVEKANKQLEECRGIGTEVRKKICLLVNRFHYVWTVEDFASSLSHELDFYLNLSAIDEIWFFNCFNEKLSKPFKIWSRNHTLFLNGNLDKLPPEDFGAWFAPLVSRGDRKDIVFSYIVANPAIVESLSQSWKLRGYLADLVDWAMGSPDKIGKALEYVEKLFEMLNGPLAEGAENEENSSDSLSTLGQFSLRLAFIIQKICIRKELIPQALKYSMILLNHRAEIVREHGLIPFSEITARHEWLDHTQREEVERKIVALVNEPIQQESYQDSLGSLLCNCRWLKTEQALEIIAQMPKQGSYADAFVVFAIGNMHDDAYDYTQALGELRSAIFEMSSEYSVELSRTVIRRLEDPNIADAPKDCIVRLYDLIGEILNTPCQQDIHDYMSYSFDQYAAVDIEKVLEWQTKVIEKVAASGDCYCTLYLKNTILNGAEKDLNKVKSAVRTLMDLPDTAYLADLDETTHAIISNNSNGKFDELVTMLSERLPVTQ